MGGGDYLVFVNRENSLTVVIVAHFMRPICVRSVQIDRGLGFPVLLPMVLFYWSHGCAF